MKNFAPLGDLASATWKDFEKNWKNYVGINALFTIIQIVIIIVLVFAAIFLQLIGIFGSIPLLENNGTSDSGILIIILLISSFFLLFLFIFGLAFILNSWMISSLIFIMAKKYPAKASFINLIKLGWPKVWQVFGAFILISLIVFVGLILFIIPGIIFGLWLSQTLFLIILEDLSIGQAMKKSKEMVKGYLGTIFLYNFVVILIVEFVIIFINIIPFLGSLVASLLGIVVTPFILLFQYQIFLQLKKIKYAPSSH